MITEEKRERMYSTRDVAKLLQIRPDALSRALWCGRLDPPQKNSSGDYVWTLHDVQRASWALFHRAYEPKQQGGTNE